MTDDLAVLVEVERRERYWRAVGWVVGGLLSMWIYRRRRRP